ncbi:hypothetical protein SAMN02746041_01904 [Desulfacinum hydrothermale DSM 13146]|uniref:GatB/YqeY domain-containing protein n=1 Tax=Desulfacinum hydrothermale DSM 13146 TaxID=1121390 RepID=A0A1W1XJK1_9BACT|nr:GatB/YqeY domain-containing protein [Desulfacinum hydrothermale]SMC24002.1 hypothetical protein SAMN02746041_01904 [Desulfacinum hydrothermale DSM 13146]
MELLERINTALKEAIKSKDTDTRNAIRMLLTAIKNKEKELRRELQEQEILQLIATAIKQRKDSIAQYEKGGRTDLAEAERREVRILQQFMPEELSPEALQALVREVIQEVGATSVKDLGKVMKPLMAKIAGRADGKTVHEMVRQELSG